jgi:cytidine deaminase
MEKPAPAMTIDPAVRAELVRRALAVRQRAYAPYSHFHVGAAVLTASGTIYEGCNVENASYGLCICAERSAIAAAIAAGQRDLLAIAVVGGTDSPATPCGACRQVMVEFAPNMLVLMASPADPDHPQSTTAADLLPGYFSFGDNK